MVHGSLGWSMGCAKFILVLTSFIHSFWDLQLAVDGLVECIPGFVEIAGADIAIKFFVLFILYADLLHFPQ